MIGKLGPKIKEGCNARFVVVISFPFAMYAMVSWDFGDSSYVVVPIYLWYNLVFSFVLVYGTCPFPKTTWWRIDLIMS